MTSLRFRSAQMQDAAPPTADFVSTATLPAGNQDLVLGTLQVLAERTEMRTDTRTEGPAEERRATVVVGPTNAMATPGLWSLHAATRVAAVALSTAAILTPTLTAAPAHAQKPPAQNAATVLPAPAAPSPIALQSLAGHSVEISVADGPPIAGELLAAGDAVVVLARLEDGAVFEIPTSSITAVRLLTVAGAPPTGDMSYLSAGSLDGGEAFTRNRSTGMMVTGIVLTSIGGLGVVGYTLGTAAQLAASGSASFAYYGLPMLAVSSVLLGAGIPMWIVGGRDVEVQPNFAATGERVSGGLSFTF